MAYSSTKYDENTTTTSTPTTPPHNTSRKNTRSQYRTPPGIRTTKTTAVAAPSSHDYPSTSILSSPSSTSPPTAIEIPTNYYHHNPHDNDDEPISHTSFSPSKARAQAKATHQLGQLKTWLKNLLLLNSPELDETLRRKRTDLLSRWETEFQQLLQQQQQDLTTDGSHNDNGNSDNNDNKSNNSGLASEITKAMQELMLTNQTADAYRKLVHEAKKEELDRFQLQAANSSSSRAHHHHLLYDLEARLSPQAKESLLSLAGTAVHLGVVPLPSSPSSSSTSSSSSVLIDELAMPLMEQTRSACELADNVRMLESLNKTLHEQLEAANGQLRSLQEDKSRSEHKTESLQAQTSQWQRETKQILLKIQEYHDRIATLDRTRPGSDANPVVLIEDLAALKEQVVERRNAVRQLEDRIKGFGGLPADLEASREEVKRARAELYALRRKREEMFEDMVG